jgi:hypothetical protein
MPRLDFSRITTATRLEYDQLLQADRRMRKRAGEPLESSPSPPRGVTAQRQAPLSPRRTIPVGTVSPSPPKRLRNVSFASGEVNVEVDVQTPASKTTDTQEGQTETQEPDPPQLTGAPENAVNPAPHNSTEEEHVPPSEPDNFSASMAQIQRLLDDLLDDDYLIPQPKPPTSKSRTNQGVPFFDRQKVPVQKQLLPQSTMLLAALHTHSSALRESGRLFKPPPEEEDKDKKSAEVLEGPNPGNISHFFGLHDYGNKNLNVLHTFSAAEFLPQDCKLDYGSSLTEPAKIEVPIVKYTKQEQIIRAAARSASLVDLCLSGSLLCFEQAKDTMGKPAQAQHLADGLLLHTKAHAVLLDALFWATRAVCNSILHRRDAALAPVRKSLGQTAYLGLRSVPFHHLTHLFGGQIPILAPDLMKAAAPPPPIIKKKQNFSTPGNAPSGQRNKNSGRNQNKQPRSQSVPPVGRSPPTHGSCR